MTLAKVYNLRDKADAAVANLAALRKSNAPYDTITKALDLLDKARRDWETAYDALELQEALNG